MAFNQNQYIIEYKKDKYERKEIRFKKSEGGSAPYQKEAEKRGLTLPEFMKSAMDYVIENNIRLEG